MEYVYQLESFKSSVSNRFVLKSTYPISPARLFELHSRPEALRRLSPWFPPVQHIERDGRFETGTVVRIRIGVGPLTFAWTAMLEEVVPGKRFVDVQQEGPFRAWRHEHGFLPAPGGCLMRDEVTWTSRLASQFVDRLIIAPMLRGYFRKRHLALRRWVNEETGRR